MDLGRLEEAMDLLKRQKAICEELGDRASLQDELRQPSPDPEGLGHSSKRPWNWSSVNWRFATTSRSSSICASEAGSSFRQISSEAMEPARKGPSAARRSRCASSAELMRGTRSDRRSRRLKINFKLNDSNNRTADSAVPQNSFANTRCYRAIENQVVPMTYLVAKPYSPRGSGRGECINNGRQALPSLVRPRFLPGDQKGFGALQLFLFNREYRGDLSRVPLYRSISA